MPTNFEIDSVDMTEQPSVIRVTEVKPGEKRVSGGGYTAYTRAKGVEIRVTWGVGVSPTAVMAELRTKRGSTISHQIGWDDPSAAAQTYQVNFPPIGYDIQVSELYGPITVIFREQP